MAPETKPSWQDFSQQSPETLTTEIPKINISPDHEPDKRIKTLFGNFYSHGDKFMFYKEALVMLDDFGAGETFSWFFPETEVQYVLKGKAEMTYSCGAASHTEQKTMQVEAGDVYIIPPGTRVTWKVAPGEPFRHLDVLMPFPKRAWGAQRPEGIDILK